MNAFEKVIGYESIKSELLQICDMLKNRKFYDELGANLPNGVLLYGNPGLGKTLMAKCFIEESGLNAFIIRKDKCSHDFICDITGTFRKAKENAPCIVFLDDMDKFANEDLRHRDADEYVAVQSGIDEVKNYGVFVLATANTKSKLPDSLVRTGRFDRKIEVGCPTSEDARGIIAHYLSDKKVSPDVNMDDLAKTMSYSSCAELETILNEAAISAAYRRKSSIDMADLVRAVLRMQYNSPDNFAETSYDEMKKVALHEAGHLVVAEVLCPESVGLASIQSTGKHSTNGFIHTCKDFCRKPDYVLVALAGKAAVELYYSDTCVSGCHSDIERALGIIREGISDNAALGLGLVSISLGRFSETSENMNSRIEAVAHAELERHLMMVRNILLKNRVFLEKITDSLIQKGTLLFSDIKKIKDNITITEVAV